MRLEFVLHFVARCYFIAVVCFSLERLKCLCLFFFFQAEDGIRDIGVTGVQTCALPISDAERLRCRSPIENFKSTFARIAMCAGDAMELRIINVAGGLQRAEYDGPANLQCTQIALRKCSSCKVESRARKLLDAQLAQVIGEKSNFFQLRWSRRDCFTNIGEHEELRFDSVRVLRKTTFSAFGSARNMSSLLGSCASRNRQIKFHLVF